MGEVVDRIVGDRKDADKLATVSENAHVLRSGRRKRFRAIAQCASGSLKSSEHVIVRLDAAFVEFNLDDDLLHGFSPGDKLCRARSLAVNCSPARNSLELN